MLSLDGLLVELALSGRLKDDELQRWLEPAEIGERAAVLVFALSDPHGAVAVLERLLAMRAEAADALGAPASARGVVADADEVTADARGVATDALAPPSSPRGVAGVYSGLLCAIVDASDPLALAAHLRTELAEPFGDVSAAASRSVPAGMLREGFCEARSALEAVHSSNGGAPDVASYEDLGALKLLLALLPTHALESYCRAVLGPVEGHERSYNEELLRSLDAFIEHNGHWEQAAQALYCHRHTLRYRIRRVEALTKRDCSRASDRIELWLALRGRELVR